MRPISSAWGTLRPPLRGGVGRRGQAPQPTIPTNSLWPRQPAEETAAPAGVADGISERTAAGLGIGVLVLRWLPRALFLVGAVWGAADIVLVPGACAPATVMRVAGAVTTGVGRPSSGGVADALLGALHVAQYAVAIPVAGGAAVGALVASLATGKIAISFAPAADR